MIYAGMFQSLVGSVEMGWKMTKIYVNYKMFQSLVGSVEISFPDIYFPNSLRFQSLVGSVEIVKTKKKLSAQIGFNLW